MNVVPPSPGPEFAFQIPPNWPAPPDFDPRRGYVIDPTWPDAPPGWSYWFKPAVPIAARARNFPKGMLVRIGLGVVILVVVIARFVSGSGSGTHVGSCWKQDAGSSYASVDCGDSDARYKVISEVSDPSQCPTTSDSYLDSKNAGAADRYRCLVPITP